MQYRAKCEIGVSAIGKVESHCDSALIAHYASKEAVEEALLKEAKAYVDRRVAT